MKILFVFAKVLIATGTNKRIQWLTGYFQQSRFPGSIEEKAGFIEGKVVLIEKLAFPQMG